VIFVLSFLMFVDFLAWIFLGGGIGELMGGTSSPVVVAIAQHIGESVVIFWLACTVAVVGLAYLMYATAMAMRPEIKAVKKK
jgi:hypothetical protein